MRRLWIDQLIDRSRPLGAHLESIPAHLHEGDYPDQPVEFALAELWRALA